MLKAKFIVKLKESFRGSNDTMLEDLDDWIERCQLSPADLENLYENIKENYVYKTFPTLAEIKKHWEFIYKEPVAERISPIMKQRKFTEGWSVDKLIEKLLEFRKKEILQSHEIDFMHQWHDLYSEHGICKDLEISPESTREHLEYVKQCVIKGESPVSMKSAEIIIKDHTRAGRVQPIGDLYE